MADNKFLTFKGKPLVRCKDEIYYGDMSEPYVVRFKILSTSKDGNLDIADKVSVELLRTDSEVAGRSNIVKETKRDNLFDALDFGFVWLERALKD